MTSTETLKAERRRRRMNDMRRCVAIAVSAQTDALTAGLIDDAVRLSSLEGRIGDAAVQLPKTVNAGASR